MSENLVWQGESWVTWYPRNKDNPGFVHLDQGIVLNLFLKEYVERVSFATGSYPEVSMDTIYHLEGHVANLPQDWSVGETYCFYNPRFEGNLTLKGCEGYVCSQGPYTVNRLTEYRSAILSISTDLAQSILGTNLGLMVCDCPVMDAEERYYNSIKYQWIAERLLLPSGFRVTGVSFARSICNSIIDLRVDHPSIKPTPEGQFLPRIDPIYQNDGTGKTRLKWMQGDCFDPDWKGSTFKLGKVPTPVGYSWQENAKDVSEIKQELKQATEQDQADKPHRVNFREFL